MITKKIFKQVLAIVNPVYLVGGSVRDIQLGKEAKDYDFCTPLLPDEIELKIKTAGHRAYKIGKRFGTVGFKLEGHFIEITTFRQEKYRANNRKPIVEFIDNLEQDLSRRDFTMNAIAMNFEKDKLNTIDPFDGLSDIKNKLIKTVGNPLDRVKEDPLRMLRAARFASQLNFDVDSELLKCMQNRADSICSVSRERWLVELDGLLLGDNSAKGLQILFDSNLLQYMLPELSLQASFANENLRVEDILWNRTKNRVSSSKIDIEARWAALFRDIGEPFLVQKDVTEINHTKLNKINIELVTGISARLKWSKARTENVIKLLM